MVGRCQVAVGVLRWFHREGIRSLRIRSLDRRQRLGRLWFGRGLGTIGGGSRLWICGIRGLSCGEG